MSDHADLAPRPEDPTQRIRNHRRFALTDVTFDGRPVGGATIDSWQTGAGVDRWSARVLMGLVDLAPRGELAGRLREGRTFRGRVALIGAGPALRPRGAGVVEWHGLSAFQLDDAVQES